MSSIKGLVLAGDFRQYVIWLQENEKNRSDYPYLDNEETYRQMQGRHKDTPVYLVGTYRDRYNAYKFVKERFTNLHKDTVRLGFNANPDKYREPEAEPIPHNDDTYFD